MILAFAWTEKQQYLRLVTLGRWSEIAFWKTKLSGNKDYGLHKRRGGLMYVGKSLSWSASSCRSGDAHVEP
jgi:hypothetical protein